MQGRGGAGPAGAGGGAGQDRQGGLHVIQAQLVQQGGQPVLQPLPGGQQFPAWVGGMRLAQCGQRPFDLGAGAVTASPQPAPRSAGSGGSGGSGGQLDGQIPTPVPGPGQLWTVASPPSSSAGIEASTAFVHTSGNRHHYPFRAGTRRLPAAACRDPLDLVVCNVARESLRVGAGRRPNSSQSASMLGRPEPITGGR